MAPTSGGRARVAPLGAPASPSDDASLPPRLVLRTSKTHVSLRLASDDAPGDASSASSASVLVVAREGPGRFELAHTCPLASAPPAAVATTSCRALIGAVRLRSGIHLVVLTECVVDARVLDAPVWRCVAFEIHSCASPDALAALPRRERREERQSLARLRATLAAQAKHLRFSLRRDLTRSLQRQREDEPFAREEDLDPTRATPTIDRDWSRADARFVWNHRAASTLVNEMVRGGAASRDAPATKKCTPVSPLPPRLSPPALVRGFAASFSVAVDPSDASEGRVDVALLARAGARRVGVRHHCRGADSAGEVANYAETELVVETKVPSRVVNDAEDEAATHDDAREGGKKLKGNDGDGEGELKMSTLHVVSHVQTRGSVPLFWAQPLENFYWKHRMKVRAPADLAPFEAHHASLAEAHGAIVCVDLLRDAGGERRLRTAHRDAHERVAAKKTASEPVNEVKEEEEEERAGPEEPREATRKKTNAAAPKYVAFDYHRERAEVGERRATDALLATLAGDLDEHGAFVVRAGRARAASKAAPTAPETAPRASPPPPPPSLLRRQLGALRVNCKDCLDRTNLAQSAVARRTLAASLAFLARSAGGDPVAAAFIEGTEDDEDEDKDARRFRPATFRAASARVASLERLHMRAWAAHGDALSAQYARTDALRRDVTRHGRRTILGVFADARTAATRYGGAKFFDGAAQDDWRFWLRGGVREEECLTRGGPQGPPRGGARGARGRGGEASTSCSCLNQPTILDEGEGGEEWEEEEGGEEALARGKAEEGAGGRGGGKVAPAPASPGE